MALTPKQTAQLLEDLAHTPKKKLGQNFLIDGNIVRKSVRLAGVQPGDVVLEIGPGLGTLTEALLEAGADVYAVEKDKTLVEHLRSHLKQGTFHLLEGCAVEHPLAGLHEGFVGEFKVVANLPYAISTPWLDGILERALPVHMVLMLQKEAALRYTSRPGEKHWGAIAIFLQAAYEQSAFEKVSRRSFYPVPGVDSVLLGLIRKAKPFVFKKQARICIRDIFTQRRKQVGSLAKRFEEYTCLASWQAWLEQEGYELSIRPEELPLGCWQALDKLFV